MKKLLLIVGILSLIFCVLSLFFFAISCMGYFHAMDGSAALYNRLQNRMILFSVSTIVLALIGIGSLIFRKKI